MIKLIASDIDGTMLPEGTPNLNREYYEVIRQLAQQGITFVAASGRGYPSIARLMEPVLDHITIMADNGCYAVRDGEDLFFEPLDAALYKELVAFGKEQDGTFVMASGRKHVYSDSRDKAFIAHLEKSYSQKWTIVDDLSRLDEPVMKVAMYNDQVDAAHSAQPGMERFGSRASVLVSGAHWVDYIPLGINKGTGLQHIQRLLGVTPEECAAFGDNLNDIGMLESVAHSYAVEEARAEVRETAAHTAGSMYEDAVLKILKTYLQ